MMRTPDRLRGIGGAKREREVYIREVATEASFFSALYRHLIPMDRKASQREQEKKEKEGLSDNKKKKVFHFGCYPSPGRNFFLITWV